MSDHDAIISQFTSMTGCDTERAKFYLESSNWDIGPALETYFDSGAQDAADVDMDEEDVPSGPQQPHGQAGFPRPTARDPKSQGGSSQGPPKSQGGSSQGPPKSQGPPVVNPPSSSARIATFSSIRKPESEDDSDEDRDKDDEQEFYVGSGQEVLGPGKKRNPDEIISSIFKSARQHGAEQVEESTQPSLRTGQPRSFGGSGMRLGDSSGGGSTNPAVVRPAEDAVGESHNPVVTLRMWRNGFTINDGQLRLYSDPANHQFMESVKQGRVPPELIMAAKGRELRVQMEDKRDQEFQAPKRQAEYFGGTGHMLGSPAPGLISKPSVSATSQSQSQSSESDKKSAEEKAKSSVVLDSSQPATNIQIRLPDGSRLINRFNETHSVADIRRFIQLARPEFASHDFQMLVGFPSKPLTDEKASLKDANLLNASINVK